MPRPLHMIQMALDLPAVLQRGRRLGLGLQTADLGYLVHCHLAGLFGDGAPTTFSIREQSGRRISLLGYSAHSGQELQNLARSVADPDLYGAIRWDELASKPLPLRWEKGSRFKFEVRTSPVQRLGRANRLGKPGAEVDAFLAHCWREDIAEGANRAAIYEQWLRNETGRLGGASLLQVDVAGFQLERFLRRTQGPDRKGRTVTRPVATFRGRLEIQDPDKFHAMIERGIGRHRAFGLGMLLLRA